jgi:dihydrofolate reductase
MNTPKKYVVSKTLERAIWRDTTILRDDVVAAVRALKASAGKTIMTDGSSQLVHTLIEHDLVDELILHVYPVAFGTGKRLFPASGLDQKYALVKTTPYPTGVVGLRYRRLPA